MMVQSSPGQEGEDNDDDDDEQSRKSASLNLNRRQLKVLEKASSAFKQNSNHRRQQGE